MGKTYYLLCYTREPLEDSIYSRKLAYSMHLALSEDGEHFTALNHNSGILYAKAVSLPDGTLCAKCLAQPKLLKRADGSFGVTAKRVEVDGSLDRELRELVLAFRSDDLIHYQELGAWGSGADTKALLHEMGNAMRRAMAKEAGLDIQAAAGTKGQDADATGTDAVRVAETAQNPGKQECGQMQEERGSAERFLLGRFTEKERAAIRASLPGAIPGNMIEISEETAERLKCHFLTPINTANEVPETVEARGKEKLDAARA